MLVFIPIRLIIRLIVSQFDDGHQDSRQQTLPLLTHEGLTVHEGKERALLGDGIADSAAPGPTPANVFLTDGTNLQSVSDGASTWRAQRHLMRAWCIISVVALFCGGILSLSAIAAVIGIVCSVRFLCRVNQPTPAQEAAANIRVVFRLAIVAAVLSGLWTACYLAIAIIAFLAPDKDDDNILMGIIFLAISASPLALTVTSSIVAHRAKMINRQMTACSILV